MSYIFLALLRLFNIATYIPVGSFKQTFIFVWYTPIPRATLQTLLSFLYIIRYTFTLVLLTNRNCLLRNRCKCFIFLIKIIFSLILLFLYKEPLKVFQIMNYMHWRLLYDLNIWRQITYGIYAETTSTIHLYLTHPNA